MDHINGRPAQVTITLTSAGSPALRPELADTTAIGLVFEPRWAEGRESIDRHGVDLASSIAMLGAQHLVERSNDDAPREVF